MITYMFLRYWMSSVSVCRVVVVKVTWVVFMVEKVLKVYRLHSKWLTHISICFINTHKLDNNSHGGRGGGGRELGKVGRGHGLDPRAAIFKMRGRGLACGWGQQRLSGTSCPGSHTGQVQSRAGLVGGAVGGGQLGCGTAGLLWRRRHISQQPSHGNKMKLLSVPSEAHRAREWHIHTLIQAHCCSEPPARRSHPAGVTRSHLNFLVEPRAPRWNTGGGGTRAGRI